VRSRLRRAGAFAAVGSLALAAPTLGRAAAAPFVAVAVFAAVGVSDGPLFDLFARPGDYEDRRLNGLAGFALAATVLALLATVPRTRMPLPVFVASVLLLAYGNLGKEFVATASDDPFVGAAGFVVGATLAGAGGWVAAVLAVGATPALALAGFLGLSGALVAGVLRSVLFERDDPLVMLSAGLSVWLLALLAPDVGAAPLLLGVGLTLLVGGASYALDLASVTGMLTGVLLVLLTVVLGGFGWFAVLVAFFGVGGVATKVGYERKRDRGVAEDNEGARGSGNVLGNAAVALVAVLGFAAAGRLPVPALFFTFAFAGSLATALADTLSSEVGGLFDGPRLITTLEPVPPGTDGGVTWQGELAGGAGAAVVGAIAAALLPFGPAGAAVVVAGGLAGMTVDSLLGATLEGSLVGNELVNLLATFAGALASVALAVALGVA
jgi:uncharacterized protein (TIGR00297 family)